MIHLYAFDTPDGRKISIALEEMQLRYDVTIFDIGKRGSSSPGSSCG